MSPARTILLLLPFSIAILISCNDIKTKDLTKHYNEDMLEQFAKICKEQQSRDTGIHLLDSVYATFPYITVPDKYRYYNFKRDLFELIRDNDLSYDTAIHYLDSMITIIEDNNLQKEMHQDYLKAFNIRSDYFTRRKRYHEATLDLTRCRQLNQEAGDSCMMAENTRTLSLIAINQSDYALAARLLHEALALATACKKDWDQFVRMQRYLDDLGFVYATSQKYDSALLYHFQAMKYIEQNKDQYKNADTLFPYIALKNIYGNISAAYELNKELKPAEVYIQKAIAIEKDITNNYVELAQEEIALGRILFKMGKINEAYDASERALPQLQKFDLFFKTDIYRLKYDIAMSRGEYKAAADYQEKFRLVKDSIYNSRIDVLKNNPFTEFERLDKKYQVELLEKDNRNQRNKTNAAIIIGVLSILLVILSLFFLQRLRRVMKKRAIAYKKLLASEIALKETMEQKESAQKELQEKELFAQEMRLQLEFNEAIIQQRQQISDDMHDELSSSLAALKFYSEDIKKRMQGTTVEKPIAEIADEIKSVYENARRYMHNLKSNNHETALSLTGFLKEIQRKFSEKNLLKVTLKIDEEDIKASLSPLQHNQLYHIIKEAVSNIIKHANATAISISISMDRFKCHFSIADNGRGFSKEKIIHGIGINSMMNRIKELDGDIDIAADKNGTRINGFFLL